MKKFLVLLVSFNLFSVVISHSQTEIVRFRDDLRGFLPYDFVKTKSGDFQIFGSQGYFDFSAFSFGNAVHIFEDEGTYRSTHYQYNRIIATYSEVPAYFWVPGEDENYGIPYGTNYGFVLCGGIPTEYGFFSYDHATNENSDTLFLGEDSCFYSNPVGGIWNDEVYLTVNNIQENVTITNPDLFKFYRFLADGTVDTIVEKRYPSFVMNNYNFTAVNHLFKLGGKIYLEGRSPDSFYKPLFLEINEYGDSLNMIEGIEDGFALRQVIFSSEDYLILQSVDPDIGDYYIKVYDKDFQLLGESFFNQPSSGYFNVVQVNDGFIFLHNYKYITKLDFQGNKVFTKSFAYNGVSRFLKIIESSEPDHFYLLGEQLFGQEKETTVFHVPIDALSSSIERDAGSEVNIFPNPAMHEVNIEIENSMAGINRIMVFDSRGTSMISLDGNLQNQQKLDVSTLPKGFYLIQIFLKNGKEVISRFVKA
jgi:hypothetical protein